MCIRSLTKDREMDHAVDRAETISKDVLNGVEMEQGSGWNERSRGENKRHKVTIVFMSVVDTDEFGDGVLKLAASTDFYGAGYFWIWTHLQEISARTPA
ncbi:unnamed protein product [Fusarium graminearum]|uniref:Chromosome 4, complete genome n=2 Tax=Gibberella zeae TaxID=5518 RepID=A0A098DQN5_GIBZE|nr:unnamed protein product [Fusarium graminearum]CAF3494638.1 unnamed protein product [Fusarium graminearum]CAG1979339.1 unnamed protein product [Fusarium graminearum]CAG1998848.1 unnamed protein product [Fusarium graminearum]CEF84160.1 unnamed protein product [Fusarium graminearum]